MCAGMLPRWLRIIARLVAFSAALIGFGMGCTADGDSGITLHGVQAGFMGAAILSIPTLVIGAIVCTVVWIMRRGWRPYHLRPGHCPECDYELPAHGAHTCPECGRISTNADREPASAEGLWATPVVWGTRVLVVVLAGCLAAQMLALLEEQTTRWTSRLAFARATRPIETDTSAPDVGYWTPLPGKSCRTPYGWVDWNATEGRVFRPYRWTPWPHLGTLVYVEKPSFGVKRKLIYWMD